MLIKEQVSTLSTFLLHFGSTRKNWLVVFLFFVLLFWYSAMKTMFKLENMKRFINFLSPNCCNDNVSNIDFKCLSKVKARTVGVFGSKKEIVDTLKQLGFGTTSMYVLELNKSKKCILYYWY